MSELEPSPAASARAGQGSAGQRQLRHLRRRRRRFRSPEQRRRRDNRLRTGRSLFAARCRVRLQLQGIKLQAPLALFRMTPGDFVVEVSKPSKKKNRKIKFTITVDQQTTLDLDKR